MRSDNINSLWCYQVEETFLKANGDLNNLWKLHLHSRLPLEHEMFTFTSATPPPPTFPFLLSTSLPTLDWLNDYYNRTLPYSCPLPKNTTKPHPLSTAEVLPFVNRNLLCMVTVDTTAKPRHFKPAFSFLSRFCFFKKRNMWWHYFFYDAIIEPFRPLELC